jgi:hypothetical protein
MRPADLVDMMVAGIEAREPLATFGRLSTREHGFVVAMPDASGFVVTVRTAFDFGADDIAEPPEEGPAVEVEWDVLVIAGPGVETVVTGVDIHLLVNGVPRIITAAGEAEGDAMD